MTYLVILGLCVLVTLPLEFLLGARVYREPRRLVLTLLFALPAFLVWDVVAAARGIWWFSEQHTIGVRLLGLPIEEWLFFVVVPLCGLLTYEAVGNVLARIQSVRSTRAKHVRVR